MRARALAVAASVMVAGCVTAGAAQAKQNLTLDLHVAHNQAYRSTPVSTAPLVTGQRYYAIVAGTISIYPFQKWSTSGGNCGASEPSPMFPSPSAHNGQVGQDSETVFASPPHTVFNGFTCTPSQIPFESVKHAPQAGFEVSTDGSKTFAHMEPVGGPRSVPRVDHTYTYALTGTGAPASFKFIDDTVDDNYGEFHIQVLSAAECGAVNCLATAGTVGDQTPAPNGKSGQATLLSSAKACVSHHRLVVALQSHRGVSYKKLYAITNGKTAQFAKRTFKHKPTTLTFSRLPRGTIKLTLTAVTTRGQVLRQTHRYMPCTATKKKKK